MSFVSNFFETVFSPSRPFPESESSSRSKSPERQTSPLAEKHPNSVEKQPARVNSHPNRVEKAKPKRQPYTRKLLKQKSGPAGGSALLKDLQHYNDAALSRQTATTKSPEASSSIDKIDEDKVLSEVDEEHQSLFVEDEPEPELATSFASQPAYLFSPRLSTNGRPCRSPHKSHGAEVTTGDDDENDEMEEEPAGGELVEEEEEMIVVINDDSPSDDEEMSDDEQPADGAGDDELVAEAGEPQGDDDAPEQADGQDEDNMHVEVQEEQENVEIQTPSQKVPVAPMEPNNEMDIDEEDVGDVPRRVENESEADGNDEQVDSNEVEVDGNDENVAGNDEQVDSNEVEGDGNDENVAGNDEQVSDNDSEADDGETTQYVFNKILDMRWAGDAIELLVDWYNGDPTWEPEANIHRDAPDTLFEYWRDEHGGRPENPNDPGLYDIFAVIKHAGSGRNLRLLVEWTGFPPEERTWEPAKVVQKAAPEIVEEYWRVAEIRKQKEKAKKEAQKAKKVMKKGQAKKK